MRDKSFEVGPSCKVAKRETLGSMYAKSAITGGQSYQRMCGDYSKTSHADHDKMMQGMNDMPNIGSGPKRLGSLG